MMFTLARLFYNNCGDTVHYNSLKQLRLHLTRNSLLRPRTMHVFWKTFLRWTDIIVDRSILNAFHVDCMSKLLAWVEISIGYLHLFSQSLSL